MKLKITQASTADSNLLEILLSAAGSNPMLALGIVGTIATLSMGPGSAAADTFLKRNGGGGFDVARAAGIGGFLRFFKGADAQQTVDINSVAGGGRIQVGPGGATAVDTSLE